MDLYAIEIRVRAADTRVHRARAQTEASDKKNGAKEQQRGVTERKHMGMESKEGDRVLDRGRRHEPKQTANK